MTSAAVRLPTDPHELAAALPDVPRWVEVRSLLRSGEGVMWLGDARDGAVVLDPQLPSGFVIGRCDGALLRTALADVPGDFELVVQIDGLDAARAALPNWRVALATVHSPARPWQRDAPPEPGVVLSAPPDARVLAALPEDIRRYAALAEVVAVKLVGALAVAVCAAGDVTETLWDVGVDTLRAHRRRGYAAAAFRALAAHMAAVGKQPVWAAEEDNAASMRLAAKLGFEPVGRLALMSSR